MSTEYGTTAKQLAQNIAGLWKIASDEGLSEKGMKELIKASIKPTQSLLKLAECYNVSNAGFKRKVLSQVQNDLEQEKARLLEVV